MVKQRFKIIGNGIFTIRWLEFLHQAKNRRTNLSFGSVVLYCCANCEAFRRSCTSPLPRSRRLTVRSDTIILRRKSNFYQSKGGYDHLSSSYFHTMDQIGHESLHSSIVKNQRLKSQITHNFVLLNFFKRLPFKVRHNFVNELCSFYHQCTIIILRQNALSKDKWDRLVST